MDALYLLSTLRENEKHLISQYNYHKNEIIHFIDDSCNTIDIIIKGEVSMTKYDINGNEVVFNYLRCPNIYGNNLIFATSNSYLGNVVATTETRICQISKNNLQYLLSNNINFLNAYLNIIADKSLELSQKLQIMSIQNVDKRVLSFLKMQFKKNNGVYLIKSITNFAKELSLPRETVSRAIKRLADSNKFMYSKNTFKEIKNALDLF